MEKMEKMENNGENSSPLTSLPVDRLMATDYNAAARANICMRGGGQKSLTRKIPKSKDQESLDLENLYESGLIFYQNE